MNAINRLLNIRQAEWPRFLFLYLTMFVTNAGFLWGRTIVEAEFLQRPEIGVAFLPWVLIVSALFSIGVSAVYTAFADRLSNDLLLVAIYLIGAAGTAVGIGLLAQGQAFGAYMLLYPLLLIAADMFNLHWATYVNGFYDAQASKRLFPLIASAARVASIVAGLMVPLLNQIFQHPSGILFTWLGTFVLAALITWAMPLILKERSTANTQSTPAAGYLGNIREGYQFVRQSAFLRWMAFATVTLMLLIALLTYQSSAILKEHFAASTDPVRDMSSFLGLLNSVTNLLMLPFLFVILSRIIGRIGIGNANMIFPSGNLAISAGLVLWPSWITASLAYFDRMAFRLTFHFTLDSLLYNAVPLRIKGRARGFINGLLVPVGTLAGGLLLLLVPLLPGIFAWLLPLLIALLAIGFFAIAVVIRREYTRALLAMLEQEDYSFLLAQGGDDLSVTDPAMLGVLRHKLEASTSPELTIFMAKLISEIGGSEAAPILGQVARNADDPRMRSGILDVLAAAQTGSDAMRRLMTDFLADPDARVRESALAGLAVAAGESDPAVLSAARAMLSDPAIEVRMQAIRTICRADDTAFRDTARDALRQMLASDDAEQRARGVALLEHFGDTQAAADLIANLADPADAVRLEAAVATENLVVAGRLPDELQPQLHNQIATLLHDPIERVRQAILIIAGKSESRTAQAQIVTALADPSLAVRATAADVLVQIGRAAIPIVHPQLDSADGQLRRMAAVILSRIDRREFGALIESQITGNLLTIYRNHGRLKALEAVDRHAGVNVLSSALREQGQQLADESFYLLSALHSSANLQLIVDSLRNNDPRVRANAIEALESLTSPQTTRLLAPLIDPATTSEQLLRLGQDTWDMPVPETTQVFRQLVLEPGDPWLRAIAIYALGEIGTAQTITASDTNPPAPRRSAAAALDALADEPPARPRRRAADLLGALGGDRAPKPAEEPPADTAATDALQPPPRRRAADILGAVAGASTPDHTMAAIEKLLEAAANDPAEEVRSAARAARRMLERQAPAAETLATEEGMLSIVERIIFLKEVPFFQAMTIDQLKILAGVCEEQLLENERRVFNQGDPGGALYVVVSGRVAIEQERRKGSFARLATVGAHSYFGELGLFDDSPRTTSAITLQDTLVLRLRREPLVALMRQYPDLSLKLINVLNQRLREANDRIAELAPNRPRELHKFFDRFDDDK